MKLHKHFKVKSKLFGAFALLSLGLAASSAHAGNFEAFFGEAKTTDEGQDVKAANYCPDKGSIVVGTRRTEDAVEALVTRAKEDGGTMWQYAYRIAGSRNSSANAVVELTSGEGFA